MRGPAKRQRCISTNPRSRAASCTPSKLNKPRILVIDDESAIRDSLKMILEYEGYQFMGAVSGQDGLAAIQRERPDAVLLDIKMPGMDGMEVLRLSLIHISEPTR